MEAPTKSRIEPKLGTDSAMNKRQRTEKVLKAQRFQLKSGEIKSFEMTRQGYPHLMGH